MSTTIRVRSQITRRASGKYDPEDTVEIATDDPNLDLAATIRIKHEEVYRHQQIQIARREVTDHTISRSIGTQSLTG